jgi:MATE family multidrug resistance protein
VGQRLGEDRADLAERSTWAGVTVAWAYMTAVGLLFFLIPGPFVELFRSTEPPEKWQNVALLVTFMLRFVALYCLFDSINVVLSFALKGAGDTLFVTATSLVLAWPVLVLPTYLAWIYDWGWWWAWAFATAFVILLACTFFVRFLRGRWKTMRVIEPVAVAAPEARAVPVAVED